MSVVHSYTVGNGDMTRHADIASGTEPTGILRIPSTRLTNGGANGDLLGTQRQ